LSLKKIVSCACVCLFPHEGTGAHFDSEAGHGGGRGVGGAEERLQREAVIRTRQEVLTLRLVLHAGHLVGLTGLPGLVPEHAGWQELRREEEGCWFDARAPPPPS